MSKASKKPARAWRVIADEMSHATRGERILELAEELEQAFQEQTSNPPHKPANPAGPPVADQSRNGVQENPEPRKARS